MATAILDSKQNEENNDKPDKSDLKQAVKTVVDTISIGDKTGRESLVRLWKRNLYYWSGIQHIFYSDVSHDWRTPFDLDESERESLGIDLDEVSRVINKYRGHGEAFIAALSAGLPNARFFPDDADNPDDIVTSQAFSKIAELISKHNDSLSQFVYALFTVYNQSFAAAHTYYETSHKYGTEKLPNYSLEEQKGEHTYCSSCGEYITPASVNFDQQGVNDQNVKNKNFEAILEEEGMSDLPDYGNPNTNNQVNCPTCGPQESYKEEYTEVVPVLTGFVDNPKGRTRIDIHGSLEVRLPINIRKLDEAAYLILENEQNCALMQELYPEENIMPSSLDIYERWGREPAIPTIQDPNLNMVTVKQCWIRPWAYNILGHANPDIDALREEYPNGFCAVIINDKVVECRNECLDDHWTITESPLSRHIHADPIGNPFIPIQNMINDLVHLTMETIEHEIPVTFADSKVLDFDAFKKTAASPGSFFPVKVPSGRNLDQMFHSIKPSALSQYVQIFGQQLDKDGEFVIGTQPGVYGGQIQGSDTLGEYEIRRNQALQRLSTTWKMINSWWAKVMSKAVRLYANNMQSDETFVKESEGSFINVVIKRADLSGKVGNVEAETSEQFPISWQQKRGVIFELMNANKPAIEAALFHPENLTFMKSILGLSELHIPGNNERLKELRTISELIKGQPTPDPMSPMGMTSSVPIDPDLDDDVICIEACKSFLNSEVGQQLKTENQAGYQNVLLHMKEHQFHQMTTMAPPIPPEEGGQEGKVEVPPNSSVEPPPTSMNESGQL